MGKRKNISRWISTFSVISLLAWFFFSIRFFYVYQEASVFATEGAQPIIKILEILNYRGEELLSFFISFFILVSLSFLFLIYLFLYIKKYNLKNSLLIITGIFITFFITINLINELFLFLLVLIVVSFLIMVSIGITVKYLYVEEDDYEERLNSFSGPFKTLSKAEKYAEQKVNKIKKKSNQHIVCKIDSEIGEGYYVNIYIEETDNGRNENNE
ncbi:hypothetical protein [Vagococcus fluvialis]|uniref:hypothetical protein n=1 Tax=Vagococcus fluvialis TaxID=2738 RepID=UPI003B214AA0